MDAIGSGVIIFLLVLLGGLAAIRAGFAVFGYRHTAHRPRQLSA